MIQITKSKFNTFSIYSIRILALIILFYLLSISFKWTTYVFSGIYPLISQSTGFYEMLGFVLSILLIFSVRKLKLDHFFPHVFWSIQGIAFILRLIILFSFVITPAGDMQSLVSSGIEFFHFGDLNPLWTGGYVSIYLHQIGLMTLLSPLFKTFLFNYIYYYGINLILIQGSIIFLSYSISSNYGKKAGLVAAILLNTFIPAYFMTFYIYGDVIALVSLSFSFLLMNKQHHNKRRLGIVLLLLIIAYWSRTSSIVWIIAFMIVIVLSNTKFIHKGILITLLFLSLSLPQKGLIYTYNETYNLLLGQQSLPTDTWIAIGTGYSSIDGVSPGFYNSDFIDFLKSNYYDQKSTSLFINARIQANVDHLLNNNEWINFFSRKTILTWTDPDFESMNAILPINYNSTPKDFDLNQNLRYGSAGPNSKPTTVMGEFIINHMFFIRSLEKMYLSFVLTLALYSLWIHRKSRNLTTVFLELLIIGVFLLMAVLETKPRYTFVFMMFLISYASTFSTQSE